MFRRTASQQDFELHLGIPKRSYEAENNARWVNAVLGGRVAEARRHAGENLPVFVTRCLSEARRWLASRVAPNRRSGLVASGGTARLRAEGIETPTFKFLSGIDYASWFLLPSGDVRCLQPTRGRDERISTAGSRTRQRRASLGEGI